MAQYGKASYWDERYTKDPEPFDWYQRYSGIKDLLAQYARSIFARTPLQRQTCRCGRAYCSVPRLRLLLTLSRAVFRPLQVKKTDHILMVGAGNSRLTEDMGLNDSA